MCNGIEIEADAEFSEIWGKRCHRALVLPLMQVMVHIGAPQRITVGDYCLNVSSDKLRVFGAEPRCVRCGLMASFFAVERDTANDKAGYVLRLYGTRGDGREVMLTIDHIVPWSKGGEDKVWNYQTMCETCNQSKGNRWNGVYRTNLAFDAPCDAEQKRRRSLNAYNRRIKPLSEMGRHQPMVMDGRGKRSRRIAVGEEMRERILSSA